MRAAPAACAAAVAVCLPLTLAGPASAAPPTHHVVDASTQQFRDAVAQDVSLRCGFPIEVTASSGHVRHTDFSRESGTVYLGRYATRVTFSANGRTVTLRDTGPDHVVVSGETVTLFMVGRSTTGSGNIGRTVVPLVGEGEVTMTGRYVGPFPDTLCLALDPDWTPPPPPPPPAE